MTEEQINEVRALQEEYLLKKEGWREGQAFFNALHTLYPDEANSIRDTVYDCFYQNICDQTIKYLRQH